MKMNKLLTIALLLLSLACKKEDDDDAGPTVNINKELSGTINGKSWNYLQGEATSYDNSSHNFTLVDSNYLDSCNLYDSKSRRSLINVAIYTNNEKNFIGKHNIVTTVESYVDVIIGFYDEQDNIPKSYYASSGQITITEADTLNKVVRGNMNVAAKDGNNVSGKFELKYCEW